MNWLKGQLREKGYIVFVVPETSTILLTAGSVYPGINSENRQILLDYETEYLKMQLSLEDSILSVARIQAPLLGPAGSKVVVLFDRGAMDTKAYVPSDVWMEMLQRCDATEDELLKRYDMVCHMTTAAKGAEAHYTLANNEARSETIEEARAVDDRTLQSWSAHDRHYVIDNVVDQCFQDKLERVLQHILTHLKK
ncbi:hypothetical protein EON65_31210 [archaeon]|nr:MAG: hypothetical protein EON65_31210 [archaeon]